MKDQEKENFKHTMLSAFNLNSIDRGVLIACIRHELDLYYLQDDEKDFPDFFYTVKEIRGHEKVFKVCEFASEDWLDYAIEWIRQDV